MPLSVKAQSSENDRIEVQIRVPLQVQFGERLAVSGSANWLGGWSDPKEMTWTEEGWILKAEAKKGEDAEFKFLILGTNGGEGTSWENGPNRKLTVPQENDKTEGVAIWDKTSDGVQWGTSNGNGNGNSNGKVSNGSSRKSSNGENNGNGKVQVVGGEGESEFGAKWKGREISFMRSNDHSGSRNEVWNTEGLKGEVLKLVEGDKRSGNWWRKLDVVKEILYQVESKDLLEALVYSAIYLQWINTGQLVCVEDGGHHRPNRHAEIAREIFKKLEGMKDTTAKELLVIRKIHPRLPAFTAEFTASVPLTRIRDIAHRNDIPHDLKQEIKHTIQNKLHRNAGPEDLMATEALLKRVTQDGQNYSGAFIEQLRIFYKELKDFFNASSLTEQLEDIRPSLDDSGSAVLQTFLDSKNKADATGSGNDKQEREALIGALHSLTGLRALLLKGLESGLRNDASDDSIATRQKWRLAEIGLEDYSFVLLSRFSNAVDAFGGAPALAQDATSGDLDRISHTLGATVLGIRQLGLSGWQQAECIAIENELQTWQKAGLPKSGKENEKREWALRLKATLDRTRRVAETYTEALLDLYPSSSQTLGRALGIPDNTVRTYAEAEIRASVVFQLAKLCSLLLKAVRQVAGGEGWDVLMPGIAVGKLIQVDRIVPGSIDITSQKEAVVLLVKEADGDEEVKAAGPNVAGVILCHELPHLSHLGVRARQEGVVFVTCEDEDRVADVRALSGRPIRLEATPEAVRFSAHNGPLPTDRKSVV